MAASHELEYDVDVIGERIGAAIIDNILTSILMVGILMVFLIPVGALGSAGGSAGSVAGVMIILGFLAAFGSIYAYNAGLEAYWNGQTVGKRLLDIKVLSSDGTEASLGQTILRNIPLVFNLGIFSLIAALLLMATTDRKQRMFDSIADTVVVREGSIHDDTPQQATKASSWGESSDTQF